MLTLAELRTQFKNYAGDTSIANTLVDSFLNEALTGGEFLSSLPRQTLLDEYGVDTDVDQLAYDENKRLYYLEIPKAGLFLFHGEKEPALRRSTSTTIKLYFQEQKISYSVIYLDLSKLTTDTQQSPLLQHHDYMLAIQSASNYCLSFNEMDKSMALQQKFQERLMNSPQVIKQKFIDYVPS